MNSSYIYLQHTQFAIVKHIDKNYSRRHPLANLCKQYSGIGYENISGNVFNSKQIQYTGSSVTNAVMSAEFIWKISLVLKGNDQLRKISQKNRLNFKI